MRDRRNPGEVFDQLRELGLIRLHADADELREHLATCRLDGEAITVASNDEAARLNDRIRDERTRAGIVDDTTTTKGNDGLNIGNGDLIQTRQNRTELGVANRQLWIVQHVEQDGSLWVRDAHSSRKRERSIHLPDEYVREHTHLSYAATAYGVQGVTVPASHTILTDSMGGAAAYVGMTRGRNTNTLHVAAEGMADARAQFIEAMERDRADRGLADATERATEAVRGLVADGPVKLVNDEIAALLARAERAEARAALWRQAASEMQATRKHANAQREVTHKTAEAAKQRIEQVRAEVAAPLASEAGAALTEWQQAETGEQTARDRLRATSWFGKRRAHTEHETARARARRVREQLTKDWGTPPKWNEDAATWMQRVTRSRIDVDPRVTEAEREHRAALDAITNRPERERTKTLAAYARVFGRDAVLRNQHAYLSVSPLQQAKSASQTANQAKAEAKLLRSLTSDEAAEQIKQSRAELARSEIRQPQRNSAEVAGIELRSQGLPNRNGRGRSL